MLPGVGLLHELGPGPYTGDVSARVPTSSDQPAPRVTAPSLRAESEAVYAALSAGALGAVYGLVAAMKSGSANSMPTSFWTVVT